MSNNLFDWNRFQTLLKINLKLNRGKYTAVAIITLVLAIVYVIALGISYVPIDSSISTKSYISRHSMIISIANLMTSILLPVVSCMSFSAFSTSKQRVGGLTLPASYLEKYLANVLPVTLGYFVFMLLCVISVHYLRETFIPLHNTLAFSNVLSPICSWRILHRSCFTMAFCVLGTTLWHRNTFLYTMLALILLSIIMNLSLGSISTQEKYGSVSPIIDVVFAVYCFVLSYFRFKEMEVISRF
jgi:hypothetical protein